ncbi:hypothetical protein JANAI62_10950 [Jannaschia pagri]|uniref:Uncharacterized protein n=1 Tax=Jannaschia pagri TaxID=2829797 RepID=A0ABQ4NJB7_9RHOB|nr:MULTISPECIES: hypothetical protein [unclassified Jannaschia]GIT90640.1 hypothetical protein JANAI61_10980 [Jannaschia sp. AI_61]GIT94472.1 hypothetical protein JANAI62_10950 [Jannaschia sp. AI_62]
MPDVKVATCCYCQRRTVLRATARDGHALACGSCGAPLTKLKALKPAAAQAAASHEPVPHPVPMRPKKKRKKPKKRKNPWQKLVKDVWDEIEDIFD